MLGGTDMTPYEIIEDIKSDRIKKVIFDGDTGADGDDQFALGLALRSPKMNVVAANSAPFNDDSADMAAAAVLTSVLALGTAVVVSKKR